MAYDTTELHLVNTTANGVNEWRYRTTDATATVIAAGYISDAYTKGLRVGDSVVIDVFTTSAFTTLSTKTWHSVTASVAATDLGTLSSAISGGTVVLSDSSASDPTVNLDALNGYSIGSTHYNTTTKVMWVCVDSTTGAAVWNPINNTTVLSLPLNLATSTVYFVAPFKFRIDKLYGVKNAAVGGTGSATLTCSIGTTAVTNGVLTSVTAGAAGDVYSATPTALNTGAAGDMIKIVSSGSATGTDNVSIVLTQTI